MEAKLDMKLEDIRRELGEITYDLQERIAIRQYNRLRDQNVNLPSQREYIEVEIRNYYYGRTQEK